MDLRQVVTTIRRGASSPLALTSGRLPRNTFARCTPSSALPPLHITSSLRTITNSSRALQQSSDAKPQDDTSHNNNTEAKPQPRQERSQQDDLLALLTNDRPASNRQARPNRNTGSNDARAFISRQNRPQTSSWINNMDIPGAMRPNAMPGLTAAAQEPDTRPAPFRLGPTLGRSFEIGRGPGADLARGLRQLDTRLKHNQVRGDWHRGRFHERPGLRRKRLHSERWRKRFKLDFQATVSRVRELTRKGW